MFSQVCVCSGVGGGTPSPSHNTSTGSMSFLMGTLARSGQGLPQGTLILRSGTPSQVRMEELPGLPHPLPGMGYPLARSGCRVPPSWDGVYPRPHDRTTEGVLAMRQAVCLLCSRRRTFLLQLAIQLLFNKSCCYIFSRRLFHINLISSICQIEFDYFDLCCFPISYTPQSTSYFKWYWILQNWVVAQQRVTLLYS